MRDVCIFSLRVFYAKKFTHLTKLLIIALQTNNTSRKCWVHIINSNTRAEFSKYFHILSNFEATLSKCCWNFKSNRTYIKSFSLSKGLLQGGSDFKWKIIRNGLFVNFFLEKNNDTICKLIVFIKYNPACRDWKLFNGALFALFQFWL